MDARTFSSTALQDSTWDSLTKDFASATNFVACYQSGADVYYASTPKDAAIRPLWLLVMARPSKAALKGLQMYTNYVGDMNGRSPSETGIMQLTTKGNNPVLSKPNPLTLTKPPGKVYRVSLDKIKTALAGLYKVPTAKTTVVNDIQSFTASVKDKDGSYKTAGTHTVHRLYLATAFLLLRKKHQGNSKDGVVSLVVDKTGNIVSWGMKNPLVSCWHGETSAIMALGGVLPQDGCVFSTLKPCKMCAGLIFDGGGQKTRAFYGQVDAGKDADRTVLDTGLGRALDAHKGGGLPYGLVVKSGDAKVPLGGTLQQNFLAQKATGQSSPIKYINSDAAADLMNATEEALKSKITKYSASGNLNPNTKRAVEYLVEFLKQQNILLG